MVCYVRISEKAESVNRDRSPFIFHEIASDVYYQGMYSINNYNDIVIKFDNYKANCYIDIRLSEDLKYIMVLCNGKYIKFRVHEISSKPIKDSKYKGKINTYKTLKQLMIRSQNNLNDFISKTKNEFINRKENIHE